MRIKREVLCVVLDAGRAAINPARAVSRADKDTGAWLEVARGNTRRIGRNESAVV